MHFLVWIGIRLSRLDLRRGSTALRKSHDFSKGCVSPKQSAYFFGENNQMREGHSGPVDPEVTTYLQGLHEVNPACSAFIPLS
jgi:hypothetical protein